MEMYCLNVMIFLDGAQGLKAHILFKEEDGIHMKVVDVYYISECMFCLDIYLSLVAQLRQSVVQHRVFMIGNPTSSIEELLEESCTTFFTIWCKAKLLLSTTVQIMLRVWLFLQVAASGDQISRSRLFQCSFSVEEVSTSLGGQY